MKFEISTDNFKATGEINGIVTFKIRPRSQAARMVFKLMGAKKDQAHDQASLNVVADALAQFEAEAANLLTIKERLAS